ncbi:hypothetical protein PR048_007371 [Dryococelus australis]|uniref:Uncharacterized protein n=1 Tax=Dryococelus australis TaxID=614101 RepID=A0ABQ9HUH7_9NEOP|nr:hypothetical protein PR048_007371 [Dryococelus australis]
MCPLRTGDIRPRRAPTAPPPPPSTHFSATTRAGAGIRQAGMWEWAPALSSRDVSKSRVYSRRTPPGSLYFVSDWLLRTAKRLLLVGLPPGIIDFRMYSHTLAYIWSSLTTCCRFASILVTAASTRNMYAKDCVWTPRLAVNLLASHEGELGSIPGRVTPEYTHVVIVPDDGAGRRVFLGISLFPCTLIPALLHTSIILIGPQDLAVKSPSIYLDAEVPFSTNADLLQVALSISPNCSLVSFLEGLFAINNVPSCYNNVPSCYNNVPICYNNVQENKPQSHVHLKYKIERWQSGFDDRRVRAGRCRWLANFLADLVYSSAFAFWILRLLHIHVISSSLALQMLMSVARFHITANLSVEIVTFVFHRFDARTQYRRRNICLSRNSQHRFTPLSLD